MGKQWLVGKPYLRGLEPDHIIVDEFKQNYIRALAEERNRAILLGGEGMEQIPKDINKEDLKKMLIEAQHHIVEQKQLIEQLKVELHNNKEVIERQAGEIRGIRECFRLVLQQINLGE